MLLHSRNNYYSSLRNKNFTKFNETETVQNLNLRHKKIYFF